MQKGEASNREEAVKLGRELLDAGVFAHGEVVVGAKGITRNCMCM